MSDAKASKKSAKGADKKSTAKSETKAVETKAASKAEAAAAKAGDNAPDYRDTVFLPETEFPMRAGLPKREPEWLERWEKIDLYNRLRKESKGRPRYELHDGPPYANGHLHIGHALNKILKDFVVRSHQVLGHDSRYIPGWDCHGLPIEWKIEEKYRAKGQDKDEVPINDFRGECRDFAAEWIEIQREEFKRLGVVGDWPNRYATMDYRSEAIIAREFMKFVMNETLYRGSKPVMWSPIEKTALAEAEVEYHDHESHTIWVKFPIRPKGLRKDSKLHDAAVVIWTTTPWTIPSNKGVAFSSRISYGVYEVTDAPADNWTVPGDKVVMADALAEDGLKKGRVEGFKRIGDVTAKQLEKLVCDHPFNEFEGADGFWDYDVPLMEGDFVTADAGTGFVHCAPSHGADDFELFRKNGMLDRITHNVDAGGSFAAHVPHFAGKRILKPNGKEGDANKAVIEALSARKALLARGKVKHSYPHSWRSKAPLIFRNTPQWFVAIDKPIASDDKATKGKKIRDLALKSIDDDVAWVPQAGRNRLYSMIEQRPDWVLSRQRAWGVPLTCFMKRTIESGVEKVEILRDAAVNSRIFKAFEKEGADAWYAEGARERFLGKQLASEEWEKVDDILDVWFDSGSTHAFVMEEQDEPMWPASIYLEGTDQHRGWFHSSLLQSCGTRGRAPYNCVLTHGFTMDEQGRKMSKSLGNGVVPADVVKQYGADILRLWVAQTDFTEDQRIGPEILKNVADSYRRLRNTLRYILGALADFSEEERVDPKDMPELERWVLHRVSELDEQVREGYEKFEYQKLFNTLFGFCTTDLSAFYFDIRKDALYCDGADSDRRRACRTVMDILFHRLATWLSPLLCFTMEDFWLSRFGEVSLQDAKASVHLQTLPDAEPGWRDPGLAEKWAKIRTVRRVVNGALEIERREKRIGSSLEAAPVAHIGDSDLLEAARSVDFSEICIVSGVVLEAKTGPEDAFRLPDTADVSVTVNGADGAKCQRCWKILPEVAQSPGQDLCLRCSTVVRC